VAHPSGVNLSQCQKLITNWTRKLNISSAGSAFGSGVSEQGSLTKADSVSKNQIHFQLIVVGAPYVHLVYTVLR
jgi:hypothetical protein